MNRDTFDKVYSLRELAQDIVNTLDNLIEGAERDRSIPLRLCEGAIKEAKELAESEDEQDS